MSSSYTQWCNENEGRNYPFDDTATLMETTGAHAPNDVLVDACLIVPPAYAEVYCSSMRITPHLISIAFVHDDAPLLVGTFSRSAYAPYTAVALTALVDNVSGWVAFGSHRSVVSEQYLFNGVSQSGLASRAVRVIQPPPVTWVTGLGLENLYKMYDLVTLVGANALRVYRDPTNAQKIIFDLDPRQSASFRGPCDKYADAGYQIPPVRSINGVTADAAGLITIRFIE